MKAFETILLKHKDFIEQVAKGNLAPQLKNDIVTEIINAYSNIDNTIEVLAECATCQYIYQNSFKIILAYCQSVNWFEVVVKKVGK